MCIWDPDGLAGLYKGSSASPIMSKNEWSNMYYCVTILLSKNAFEHVDLEDELVQNQLH